MICIAWHGFPQYAARCVGAFVASTDERIVVVATKPTVPIVGMEECCHCETKWVDERLCTDKLTDLLGACPRVLVMTGWGTPLFNRFRDEVRAQGAWIIGMVDNNFIFSFREMVKAIRFRLLIRRHYDAFLVPGRSGRKLLRFYGVPDRLIAEGMYSADASIFHDGKPLAERPKKVVYVGQFIERKNVRRMCEAFLKAKAQGEGEQRWELHLYGSGPLRGELEVMAKRNPCIQVHDFCQPEELAAKYREARAFCLPSLEEHWGLVVHEAALSGCVLLLSKEVGAGEDFANGQNALCFVATDVSAMTAAFAAVMRLEAGQLAVAQKSSLELAKVITVCKFGLGIERLMLSKGDGE